MIGSSRLSQRTDPATQLRAFVRYAPRLDAVQVRMACMRMAGRIACPETSSLMQTVLIEEIEMLRQALDQGALRPKDLARMRADALDGIAEVEAAAEE